MAEAPHEQQQRQVRWEAGDKAEFFSLTHRRWVSCHVEKADAESGAVMINVKPNAWLNEGHKRRLRPAETPAEPERHMAPGTPPAAGTCSTRKRPCHGAATGVPPSRHPPADPQPSKGPASNGVGPGAHRDAHTTGESLSCSATKPLPLSADVVGARALADLDASVTASTPLWDMYRRLVLRTP